MDATDESILRDPYRPFYNIFGSKPILVKQCFFPIFPFVSGLCVLISAVGVIIMTERLSKNHRGWAVYYCSITSPRMRGIMPPTREVGFPSMSVSKTSQNG